MDTKRQQKISRLIQKELGEMFLDYTRQYRGIMVSVTAVKTTPDLSIARAYLSIFPADKLEITFATIKKDSKMLRYELGKRVRHQLRVIPELHFHIDDSLDYMENIDKLLKDAKLDSKIE